MLTPLPIVPPGTVTKAMLDDLQHKNDDLAGQLRGLQRQLDDAENRWREFKEGPQEAKGASETAANDTGVILPQDYVENEYRRRVDEEYA